MPSRVLAALNQLEATEQAGVRALFDAVARQGVDDATGVGVRTLDGADPLYVLSPLDCYPKLKALCRTPASGV